MINLQINSTTIKLFKICLIYSFIFIAVTTAHSEETGQAEKLTDLETHLKNIKQLTFGGENAEAYFSADGKKLIFQSTRDGGTADQIYTMNPDGSDVSMVSTGKGQCTCSYFIPGDDRILFSSTHHFDSLPPAPPDRSAGYVWPVHASFDIFTANKNGSNLRQLTKSWGYDAEATVSPKGDKIVFTSIRNGDLDIYSMDTDGGNVKQLTDKPGYDGGAFFSPDGKKIVYRSHYPSNKEEQDEYKRLLAKGLIKFSKLDVYTMDADGGNKFKVTNNDATNFCPFFAPDGNRIIFSSNMDDPTGHNFDLYIIKTDGSQLERITYSESFDGFPMFSPDGKKLVWASNRNAKTRGETNIFIADWAD